MGLVESSMIVVLSQFVGHLSKTNFKYLARQHSLQTISVAIPAVLLSVFRYSVYSVLSRGFMIASSSDRSIVDKSIISQAIL